MLVRSWFAVSGAVLALGFVWAYVPILIPMLVIAALIGALCALTIAAARHIERRRGRPADEE